MSNDSTRTRRTARLRSTLVGVAAVAFGFPMSVAGVLAVGQPGVIAGFATLLAICVVAKRWHPALQLPTMLGFAFAFLLLALPLFVFMLYLVFGTGTT